jgi:DNA polymerase-3 subunit beta
MKFTIDIAKAKTALEASSVVLSANAQIQEILKNYMIQADSNGVLILGTDLELALIARQSAKIEEPGSCLVSGKKLSDIIRYASGKTLTFETSADKITVSSSTGKSVLLSRSTEEFPNVEDFDETQPYVSLNRAQFIAALHRVLFAVCEDETRRMLNAVSINNDRYIATDGKMVSVFLSPIKLPLENIIIPQRSIAPLIRVLSKFDTEEFKFQDTKTFMYFKLGDTVFSVRKVTIKFPEEKLLKLVSSAKENNAVKAKFNRSALIGAIERVRINSNEESHAIYLGIENGKTVIKAQDEFGNYSIESIPSSLEGGSLSKVEIFFNWLNLLDVLKAMNSESIDARFAAEKTSKSSMFIGESNLEAVLLPIETSFNQADLN